MGYSDPDKGAEAERRRKRAKEMRRRDRHYAFDPLKYLDEGGWCKECGVKFEEDDAGQLTDVETDTLLVVHLHEEHGITPTQ